MMINRKMLKAFELVLIGHPDKVCDLVSDTICKANPFGRNAIECMWGNELFVVSGETDKDWRESALVDLVRNVLLNTVGLKRSEVDRILIKNNLTVQSAEINTIVGDSGTGDNGIYFGGYHRVYSSVIQRMKDMCVALSAKVLRDWGYRTDGKFIFWVDKKGNIVDLVINCAKFADKDADAGALETFIHTFTGAATVVKVNPKGDWSHCFGFADCGLTGRKLACDGSCGLFAHGGGAMFGKDLSKADVTVPLCLNSLARSEIGKFKKSCVFSASSVIGDSFLNVYRDGKFFDYIRFSTMRDYVSARELDLFGSLR